VAGRAVFVIAQSSAKCNQMADHQVGFLYTSAFVPVCQANDLAQEMNFMCSACAHTGVIDIPHSGVRFKSQNCGKCGFGRVVPARGACSSPNANTRGSIRGGSPEMLRIQPTLILLM